MSGVQDARPTPSVVADLLRAEADAVRHHASARARVVLTRIERCQTGALGAHALLCHDCGHAVVVPNSCRDRHCPRCQRRAQADWADSRAARTLPVGHFHLVFTLPGALRDLARRHPAFVFDAMFDAAADTLHTLARQRWNARPAFTAVLHTWNRQLLFHPHLHVLIAAGGLHRTHDTWVHKPRYLFPVRVLRLLFRAKLLDRVRRELEGGIVAFHDDPVASAKHFAGLCRALRARSWVVHVEAPEGRQPHQVVRYLARYVYRVAIDDRRIVEVTPTHVTFTTRRRQTQTLTRPAFARRFLLHVLPKGLRKVRHYGLLAPANVATRLPIARSLLEASPPPAPPDPDPDSPGEEPTDATPPCPHCASTRTEWVPIPAHLLRPVPRGPP